jgi:DNA-nicking Smr family endonuclease
MARRKKRKDHAAEEPDAPPRTPAPAKLSRPFAEALRGVKPAAKGSFAAPERPKKPGAAPQAPIRRAASPRPRPSAPLDGYEYADRAAFQQAFAGVRPLGADRGQGPSAPLGSPASAPNPLDARDEDARRRLDRLVAGELRFEVVHDEDGAVEGRRAGANPSHGRALGPSVVPQASLDLHGLRGNEAEREVSRFVRERQLRGDRILIVVHGKGRHSSGEIGVLLDHTIRALTKGGAAPFVMAFRTAPERLGGLGALVVRLREGGAAR